MLQPFDDLLRQVGIYSKSIFSNKSQKLQKLFYSKFRRIMLGLFNPAIQFLDAKRPPGFQVVYPVFSEFYKSKKKNWKKKRVEMQG